ncbi:MAG TPA: MMPL family transporter [Methylomirabilota bacterium]|nr:MMPL family transporter [Methylomirabilota bacterium]
MPVAALIGRPLRALAYLACARPLATVFLALALAVASVIYALSSLTFATSTRALLPPGQTYVERYTQYDHEFADLDSIAVVVEAPSLPEATLYANRLVRQLRAENVPLKQIAYRIDPKQFEGRGLLYLSKERLANIRDAIFDYQEFMEAFAARPTLDQLADGMATQIATAFVSNFIDLGLSDGKGASDLKFVQDLVALIGTRLDRPGPYKSPFGTLFAVPGADNPGAGYFLSEDQRLLFILAEPETQKGSFTGDQRAIEGIRGAIASLKREFPEVAVGVTGKPALQNDEMVAAFRDSERATLLAFALTLGLLLAAFVRFGKPVLMLLVLTTSLCWSIGVATLVIGHLSLFSVMFISIVIGIGIDYGIYFLFRYEEELFLGRNLTEAIEITAARSGPGMLLGAVTAAGTFYVLWLTDFRGVRELGFIAGTALVLAWLAMITVLPAVLVLVDRRHAERPAGAIPRAIALERMHVPFVERLASYPKTVLVMAAVLTLVSAWGLRYIQFDYNLLNLQAFGTESVVWEKRILATAGRSGFTALASADSLDELRQKYHAFRALKSVSEVDSVLLLIPEDQPEKLKIIGDFAPLVAPVRIGRATAVDPARLADSLGTLKRRFDIASNEAPEGDVRTKLKLVAEDLGRLVVRIRQSDPQVSAPALTHLQNQIYGDFVRSFQRLQDNLSPKPIGLADVPKEMRAKFISDGGRFLLQIHPGVDIWDREGAARFVADLRSVDPDVTGTPVITYEALHLMERAYRQGTIYAILLVTLVTALTLRRMRETVLALLPLGLGLMWAFGLMYFFGLQFNMGNVFGLPLILGAAAEYGLNIVLRFMEGRDHGGPLIARSTMMAVLVSGLTTIVGFGSLMIADHRGIFGLGLLLTLGTITSLIAALVVLPVLLRMVPARTPSPTDRPTDPQPHPFATATRD